MARRTRKPAEAPGLFDQRPDPAEDRAEDRGSDRVEPRGPVRYTVGQLTEEIHRRVVGMGRVSVEGELSGLKRHTSGHVYFDLKDQGARLSCKIWRSRAAQALRFEPEEGMQVVATGNLDVYPPRGSYSLTVDRIEPLGVGALLLQLEQLKVELRGLGWFDRSRPLPTMPRRIGVVTSRDGAAFRDFLRTRSVRWPGYPVRLCHTPVQGPGASVEIADAIRSLDASGVDVIVVCRGGGSLEDLWAFNERPVAVAVWHASVPVVSGVGHESDTTLVDSVADHRAHTPTDAAQTVIPDRADLTGRLDRWGHFLVEAMDGYVSRRAERIVALARSPTLRRPDWILGNRADVLRLRASQLRRLAEARWRDPWERLRTLLVRIERHAPGRQLERVENRLAVLAKGLASISPLAVLARGYSLTSKAGEKGPVTDAAELAPHDEIETLLARGSVLAQVLEVREPKEEG